jgi:hypothetical protein
MPKRRGDGEMLLNIQPGTIRPGSQLEIFPKN